MVYYRYTQQEDGVVYGTRASVVPVVDQLNLDKLRLLELHHAQVENEDEAEVEDDSIDLMNLVEEDTEVVVTRVDSIPQSVGRVLPSFATDFLLDSTDPLNCPSNPSGRCQFLLPATIGEQETKAQLHLYQLGLLALALNRTLVLPRVSKSRMSTCGKQPFSLYYDPLALDKFGLRTISFERFLSHSLRSPRPPIRRLSAQVISIATPSRDHEKGALLIDSTMDPMRPGNAPNKILCLKPVLSGFAYGEYSPITIIRSLGWHKTEKSRMDFGESVVASLAGDEEIRKKASRHPILSGRRGQELEYIDPDVYIMHYESRYAILDVTSLPALLDRLSTSTSIPPPTLPSNLLPFSHLDYSPRWIKLADQMHSALRPFIGVHWRTETVPAENLYHCAESLVRKINEIRRLSPELTTIYLATDYPIETLTLPSLHIDSNEPIAAHSGTYTKLLTTTHRLAFQHLIDQIRNEVKGVRLTGYTAEEQRLTTVPSYLVDLFPEEVGGGVDLASVDTGLLPIMDKLLLLRADYFVAAMDPVSEGKKMCGKSSSFTEQIKFGRELEIESGRLSGNAVDRWE